MTTKKRKTTTKSDLKAALTRLLKQKDFEAISVSDIAKEAGINRGTFYLHYVDKFDMIDQLIDEILQNIIFLLNKDQPKTKEEAFAPIVKIFEYLKEDFDFIHAISLNRFNYTSHLVRNFLLELSKQIGPIKETIKTVYPLPEDYAAEVFIYSNSAIFFHWIQKRWRGKSRRNRKNLFQNVSIKEQTHAKKYYERSTLPQPKIQCCRSESRCSGSPRLARYASRQPRPLCGDGSEYDWCEEEYYYRSDWPDGFGDVKPTYHEEARAL